MIKRSAMAVGIHEVIGVDAKRYTKDPSTWVDLLFTSKRGEEYEITIYVENPRLALHICEAMLEAKHRFEEDETND